MKYFLYTFLLFSSVFSIFAQNDFDIYLREGIQNYDKGNYDEAIKKYEKALEYRPKSTQIFYEISLSYFAKGDYKKSIKYADKVLKQKENHLLEAYITKGSSLDYLGKTKKSIKLFEKAIKQLKPHYLLHYNLSINYFKIQKLDKAEENLIKAIELNPDHTSSHYLLGGIQNMKGKKIPALLASYYFLFLEANSNRSPIALQILHKNLSGNVTKDKDKPNNINISLSLLGDDDPFGPVEMMVSLLIASNSLEKNANKTEDELFVSNTKSIFTTLGE